MLFLMEQRVHVGVNKQAGPKQRHGLIWVKANDDGVVERLPIIIDKPHLVCEGINFATWRRIKQQIKKMGIEATHLELDFTTQDKKFENGGHFCYDLRDKYKELYCGKGKGTPLYAIGAS